MSSYSFPTAFVDQMNGQLGPTEWLELAEALSRPAPVSIQYNTAKTNGTLFTGEPVPWNPNGQYLPERPAFTLDPNFQAGRYYVQEAGSMLLAHVLLHLPGREQFQTALDLCAAPGGKSTILLNMLPQKATLVANEVINNRYGVLRHNLTKWGRANVITTQADPKHFKPLRYSFDLVVVDAPCSGEGMFRKTPDARAEWSSQLVTLCEARQKRILAEACPLVAYGGYLIYSTCTFNQQENDDNVAWLLKQGDFELVTLDVPEEWGITTTRYGYQCYPHRTRSEGFYLAVLRSVATAPTKKKKRKKERPYYQPLPGKEQDVLKPWLQTDADLDYYQDPKGTMFALPQNSRTLWEKLAPLPRFAPILKLGVRKGKKMVPDQALALSVRQSDSLVKLPVNRDQALTFMRKQPLDRSDLANGQTGWHLVTYDDHGLGWVNILPNRVNNYYPKEWRIRRQV